MTVRNAKNGGRILLVTALMVAMSGTLLVLSGGTVSADDDAGVRDQIDEINQEVNQKKKEVEQLNSKIDQYKSMIMEKKEESASLQEQLALFGNRIMKTELDIEIAKDEIEMLELQISGLDAKIADKEHQMGRERDIMGSLARRLYRAQFQKSTLELLLAHESFSGFFDAMYSVAQMQRGVREALLQVQSLHNDLQGQRQQREDKKVKVSEQKRALEVARRELEDDRATQENLLVETQQSELRYRYVLAELKREQAEADSEIVYLERMLRQKMDVADRLKGADSVLSWPIEPVRGLSATFHDPDYPFRHIFEHPGIDIRAYQGTPVRSAATGIIGRAKDAGMGYSYVMIIHGNDVATVYGHLSRITVREDTFVERGEVIGYSGGMPGTPGAGRLSTGPHLHFETRLNGIPVNPLQYLLSY